MAQKKHPDEYEEFHAALLDLVEQGGRGTQKKIAAKVGVTPKYISDIRIIRGGKSRASETLQEDIAKYFNMSRKEMLDHGKTLLGRFAEQFPGHHEVMRLPRRIDRAYTIAMAAAKKHNLEEYMREQRSPPDENDGGLNPQIKSYLAQHMSEADLYSQMDLLFSTIRIDIRTRLRKEGILRPA